MKKISKKRLALQQMIIDCMGVAMSDPMKFPGLYSIFYQLQRDASFDDLAAAVEEVWKRHSVPSSKIRFTQRRFISIESYKSLSHTSLLLWEVLCNEVRDTLLFTGKADYFASLLGVSRRWIIDSFKELVNNGFLYIWSKACGSVPAMYQLNPNLVCSNRFGFRSSVLCTNPNSKALDVYKGGDDYKPVSGVESSMDASLSSRDEVFPLDNHSGLAFRRVSPAGDVAPYMLLDKVDLAAAGSLADPQVIPSERDEGPRDSALRSGLAAAEADAFVKELNDNLPFSS